MMGTIVEHRGDGVMAGPCEGSKDHRAQERERGYPETPSREWELSWISRMLTNVGAITRGFEPTLRRLIGERVALELRLDNREPRPERGDGGAQHSGRGLCFAFRDPRRVRYRRPWTRPQRRGHSAVFHYQGCGTRRRTRPSHSREHREQSGRTIRIDSQVGRGTSTILLPATDARITPTAPACRHRVGAEPGWSYSSWKTSEKVRQLAALVLKRSYEVLEASENALDLADTYEGRIDLPSTTWSCR